MTADRRLRVISGNDADAAEVLAALDQPTIQVVLPPGTPGWQHQVLAITLVDLLGRVFPRIRIAVDAGAPRHPALPPGPTLLGEALAEARCRGGLTPLATGEPSLVVNIGPSSSPADLYVDATYWTGYLGTVASRLPDMPLEAGIPIGALTAACRASAHAFGHLVRSIRPSTAPTAESVYASALTYDSSTEPPMEPILVSDVFLDAVLVGAGSIGGAAVYAFAHHPRPTGRLHIVDPQSLELGNMDRAILATRDVVAGAHAKTDVALAALSHHDGLDAIGVRHNVTEYQASLSRLEPLPLVLAAVDSARSRRAIQDCLPFDLINAACHPHEVTVSGHQTGRGPCVCCLHMAQVLDKEAIKCRVLARETGLNERMVAEYLVRRQSLDEAGIRFIERHRGLTPGTLAKYVGHTLDDLWSEQLLYGVSPIATTSGRVAVAAPWVTALAGFLLAGEAMKAGSVELRRYRLGPEGRAIKYDEAPEASPLDALLTNPPRWEGSECLCRSPRRLRLIAERYGNRT